MHRMLLGVFCLLVLGALGCQSNKPTNEPSNEAHNACAMCDTNPDAKYPNVVMVAFHADWCGTCQKIGPTVMEMAMQVGMMGKFDFTDDKTKAESEKKAMELGLCHAWKTETGTGFVIVFNKNRPDEYRKLKGSTDKAEYEKLFKEMN